MRYKISRTSTHEKKPCKEAYKAPFEYWHIRTTKSPEEFDKKFAHQEGKWLSRGRNHGYTAEGYIKRQEDDRIEWAIDIENLEQLQKLITKYGSIVMDDDSIEIYDNYRE